MLNHASGSRRAFTLGVGTGLLAVRVPAAPANIELGRAFGAELGQMAKVCRWIAANRVDPARLRWAEFGVDGAFNSNGAPGADLRSGANYMLSVREIGESRDFRGRIAHQAMGDFDLFEQSSLSRHGDTLIPDLVEALFH
jgi:hypothetical protein